MITMLRSIVRGTMRRPSRRTPLTVECLDGRCLLDAAAPTFYLDDAAAYQQYVQSLNQQAIESSPAIVSGDPSLADDLTANYGLYFGRLMGNRPPDPSYPSYDPDSSSTPISATLPVLDPGMIAVPYSPIVAG